MFSAKFGLQMDQKRKRAADMEEEAYCRRGWVQAEECDVFVRVTKKSEWLSSRIKRGKE